MLSVVVYDIPAISIHAPASGATDNRIRELALSIISIHAPASGATNNPNMHALVLRFQSTLPRVERPVRLPTSHVPLGISIHAPARGATETYEQVTPEQVISIHAPASGATIEKLN